MNKIDGFLNFAFRANGKSVFEFLCLSAVFGLAQTTQESLLLGLLVSSLGACLRVWAAGYKRRKNNFFVLGPYRYVRYPFLLGSFLVLLGLCIASASIWSVTAYLLGAAIFYNRFMASEDRRLSDLVGPQYANYRNEVSAFFPQLMPFKELGADQQKFIFNHGLFRGKQRELDGIIGGIVGFGLLYISTMLSDKYFFHLVIGILLTLFVLFRAVLSMSARRRPS